MSLTINFSWNAFSLFSLWQVCHCSHECQRISLTNTVIALFSANVMKSFDLTSKMLYCFTLKWNYSCKEQNVSRQGLWGGRKQCRDTHDINVNIVNIVVLQRYGNLITAQVLVIIYDSSWEMIWSCLGCRS